MRGFFFEWCVQNGMRHIFDDVSRGMLCYRSVTAVFFRYFSQRHRPSTFYSRDQLFDHLKSVHLRRFAIQSVLLTLEP